MTDTDTQTKTGTTNQAMAGANEIAGKAKQFAKDRPYTAAALAGVVGLAILNTLRGKRSA
jgi:ElaB/YqjD/DUF883 family membrane-anchored ribosome-binding protein